MILTLREWKILFGVACAGWCLKQHPSMVWFWLYLACMLASVATFAWGHFSADLRNAERMGIEVYLEREDRCSMHN